MSQMQDKAAPAVNNERIEAQQALVDRLAKEYEKKPSPELLLQLKRRSDTLFHIRNLAKPDPMERAKQAAERAKTSALSKAITQPLS